MLTLKGIRFRIPHFHKFSKFLGPSSKLRSEPALDDLDGAIGPDGGAKVGFGGLEGELKYKIGECKSLI